MLIKWYGENNNEIGALQMKKGMLQVLGGNIVFFLFGVANSFILPKFLSIDSYANIKTIMFYLSYSGIFSLGYIEGMFIKYGGYTLYDVQKKGFGNNIKTFFDFQIVLALFVTVIIFFCGKVELLIIPLAVFAINISNYFKNFSVSTGEYKLYSSIISFEKIVIFSLNIILIFVFKRDNYLFFIIAMISVILIEIIIFHLYINKAINYIHSAKFSFKEIINNVKTGISLMLGNIVSALFLGIDRWFVKILMTNIDFALYSFAVSLEQIINIFSAPITTTLYNYLCKEDNRDKLKSIKEMITLFAFFIISAFFPVKFIIGKFISNYNESVDIIIILFLSQAISIIINGIYVNLYKAKKMQNRFLKQTVVMLGISIGLNIVFFLLYPKTISLALGTLATKLIWLFICESENNDIRYKGKELMSIIAIMMIFVVSSKFLGPFLGMSVYYLCGLVIMLLFFKNSVRIIVNEIVDFYMKLF